MPHKRTVGALGLGAVGALVLAGCNLGAAPVTYEMVHESGVQIRPVALAAGDIDGDGDLDVVIAGDSGTGVFVNDGAGAFTNESVRTPSFGSHRAISLADVDGDDDVDIVTMASSGSSDWLPAIQRNDGSGTFGGIERVTSVPPGDMTTLVTSDADSDGDVDILAAFRIGHGRHVGVYLNDGTGAFGAPATYPLGFTSDTATSVRLVAGDLDNDGDGDVVATDVVRVTDPEGMTHEETHAAAALNDGTGAFSAAGTPFRVGRVAMIFPLVPALADFDEDGHLDIAAGGSVALGDGAGGFGEPTESGVTPSGYDYIASADIDSDGHADLVGFNDALKPEKGRVLYGNGLGSGTVVHGVFTGTEVGGDGTPARQVELADIDGDGDPDVLFLAGSLGVLENVDGGHHPS